MHKIIDFNKYVGELDVDGWVHLNLTFQDSKTKVFTNT